MRKYQQPLMIIITVVIIIAFGWFFTPGSNKKGAQSRSFHIYGRTYSQEDLERRARGMQIAMFGGLGELVIGLTFGNPYSEQATENFVIDSLVLDHEASVLGITATDNEVVAAIQKLPRFQTDGKFDPDKYKLFTQNVLAPRGYTPDRFEALVRDQIRLEKLVALLGGTVEVTPGEFRAQYVQSYQKIHATVARLNLDDFKAQVTPTDEEISKVFKNNEKGYTAPEKRAVSYVQIDLSEADKALKGKDLLDARQNLANRANDIGQDLLKEGASFKDVAKKYNLEVKTTPEFAETAAPEAFAKVPQAAAVAFKLTQTEPLSDAIPAGDGYVILHLDKITPTRQLSFEEARPKVVDQIKTEKANSMLTAKGTEARAKLAAAVKEGKPFDAAAQEAGLKVETLDAFSAAEPPEKVANYGEILTRAVELADGAVSDFTPVKGGGLIVRVDKRDPVDEAEFKKNEEQQLRAASERKGMVAFIQWLQNCRRAVNNGA